MLSNLNSSNTRNSQISVFDSLLILEQMSSVKGNLEMGCRRVCFPEIIIKHIFRYNNIRFKYIDCAIVGLAELHAFLKSAGFKT